MDDGTDIPCHDYLKKGETLHQHSPDLVEKINKNLTGYLIKKFLNFKILSVFKLGRASQPIFGTSDTQFAFWSISGRS